MQIKNHDAPKCHIHDERKWGYRARNNDAAPFVT